MGSHNTGYCFTLADYRNMIARLRAHGYMAVDYPDLRPDAAHLILRHDVDMSLDYAVQMGEAERDLGLSATYFILMRSEFYNPGTPRNQNFMRQLRAQGHRIGLHFDATIHGNATAAFDAEVAMEAAQLEALAGAPVTMVSFHRPVAALLGYDALLAGREHAYMPRYFSAIGYCSDSRGAWTDAAPQDHPAVQAGRALQLLTHPIWWVGQAQETAQQRLDRFVAESGAHCRAELARNCRAYRPSVLLEDGQT